MAARQGEKPPVCAVIFYGTQPNLIQGGAARAPDERECCASPAEPAKASACALASHATASLVLEVAADTPHHGHAPNERSLPSVYRRLVVPNATSAARARARTKPTRCTTSPETARASACALASHAAAGLALEAAAENVTPRPRDEGKPSAYAALFYRA